MKRQVDEFRTHCGPHLCEHESEDLPLTWRYSVIGRDFAVSLCVSKSGGEFVVHLAPKTAKTSARMYKACDLLGGPCDVPHPASAPPPVLPSIPSLASLPGLPAPPQVSPALFFWQEYAISGQLTQPERFWRALERRAKSLVSAARRGRYQSRCCPRCRGAGSIEMKPRKKQTVQGG